MPSSLLPLPSFRWLIGTLTALAVGWLIATKPPLLVIMIASGLVLAVIASANPRAALLVLAVLAPLKTLIATESPFQLPLDIGQLAFMLAFGAWFIVRTSQPNRPALRFPNQPITLTLGLFIVLAGLNSLVAVSLSAWLNEWLKWVEIAILILIVFNIDLKRDWEWLVIALLVAASTNALIGIYEFFGGSGALHLLILDRFFRAFGTFGQPNPFGGFLGLTAPLALVMALGHAHLLYQRWRTHLPFAWSLLVPFGFYAASTALLIAGIGTSWSRGAWLAVGIAFLVVLLLIPRRTWLGLGIAITLISLFVALWSFDLIPASIINRLSSSTQDFLGFQDVRGVDIDPANYAVVERLAHWQAALNMARANPIFGIGLGNYEVRYAEFQLINWTFPLGHAHNYYLNILAEMGIIGFLAYCMVWAVIIGLSLCSKAHPDPLARLTVIGLSGAWVYLLVHSLFDNLYVNNLFIHIGLMLALLALLYNQVETHKRIPIV